MYGQDHDRLANLNRTSYRRGAGHCQDNYSTVTDDRESIYVGGLIEIERTVSTAVANMPGLSPFCDLF